MWLFGGADCFDCDNEESRIDRFWNDLWSYDIATGQWTWKVVRTHLISQASMALWACLLLIMCPELAIQVFHG